MSQYFFINKDSELPTLRVELNNDGRQNYRKFYLAIQGANSVTFSMWNTSTGIYKIANAKADIVYDEQSGCEERYVLEYKWKKRDTNEPGTYNGLFKINFNDRIVNEDLTFPKGDLIVPISEDLVIEINDSTNKKALV